MSKAGPRSKKQTQSSIHFGKIAPKLNADGTRDPSEYRGALKSVHTESLSGVISRYSRSRVLGRARPDLSPSEALPSRAERSMLAQLRVGECHLLNDYLRLVVPPLHSTRSAASAVTLSNICSAAMLHQLC